MYKIINRAHTGFGKILFLLLLLLTSLAHAQQGSQGNTFVSGGIQMTFFGAHSFVAGGAGVQPGVIKTQRTAPLGILGYANAASYTGSSDANHIDGYVSKSGTSAFVFPVGNGSKIRTVGISAPSATATFKAAYWFSNPNTAALPAGGPFFVANLGTGVTGVSNVEYWDIDGPSAVNITLSWDAASALGTFTASNIANLIVVGYNPTTSKWESLGRAGGTTGTLAATGTITANGVTPNGYSAFTFGAAAEVTTADLRPFLTMLTPTFTSTAITRTFSVRVRNMRDNTTATDPVTIRVYKPTSTSIVALTGTSATEWTITNSGLYYTLRTNSDIPVGATGNVITASLTIPAAVASGDYQFRAFIPDLSGGEVLGDNGNNNVYIQVVKN